MRSRTVSPWPGDRQVAASFVLSRPGSGMLAGCQAQSRSMAGQPSWAWGQASAPALLSVKAHGLQQAFVQRPVVQQQFGSRVQVIAPAAPDGPIPWPWKQAPAVSSVPVPAVRLGTPLPATPVQSQELFRLQAPGAAQISQRFPPLQLPTAASTAQQRSPAAAPAEKRAASAQPWDRRAGGDLAVAKDGAVVSAPDGVGGGSSSAARTYRFQGVPVVRLQSQQTTPSPALPTARTVLGNRAASQPGLLTVRARSVQPALLRGTHPQAPQLSVPPQPSAQASSQGSRPRVVRPGAITVPAPSPAAPMFAQKSVAVWEPVASVGQKFQPSPSPALNQRESSAPLLPSFTKSQLWAAVLAGQDRTASSECTTARTIFLHGACSAPGSVVAPSGAAGPFLAANMRPWDHVKAAKSYQLPSQEVLAALFSAATAEARATKRFVTPVATSTTSITISTSASLAATAASLAAPSTIATAATTAPASTVTSAAAAAAGPVASTGAEFAPAAEAAFAMAARVVEEASSDLAAAAVAAAGGRPGVASLQQTPNAHQHQANSPAWQVSPVLPVEALSAPASVSPVAPTPFRDLDVGRAEDRDAERNSGTARKSLVYSSTPDSGILTISSVASPLKSPSSCCSPSRMLASPRVYRSSPVRISASGRPSLQSASPAGGRSPPSGRRRRSTPPENHLSAWQQLYFNEVGRHPGTAEQFRAFVLHRGGQLPWCIARRVV
ncbi:unnamed protein product [Polarella glacialis]|uniref:Uncharacterized protein n=1 Tax=Polarella glacialis TaxID=89957 RepID=A0A813HNL0_POLGL|nr:unnamed protein product [Polarella glacialis]